MPDKAQILAALRGEPLQDAMPFGVGGPAEPAIESGAPGLVSGLAKAAYAIPKNLIDSAAQNPMPGLRREDYTDIPGAAQPSDSLTGASADTALALAGTGVPMAEQGAAGIFGGRLSKTADLRALQEAQQMRMGGEHPADVLSDTGWFRAPTDSLWRYEIPDNKAKINTYGLKFGEEGDFVGAPSSALLDHPELYKAYPQLTNVNTYIEAGKTPGGMFDASRNFPKDSTMSVRAPDSASALNVGLHELQHGVQAVEGFSPGSNPEYYAQMIEKGLLKNPDIAASSGYDFDAIKNQAYDLYKKTAGEVESRNVQKRQNYSPTERSAIPPWETQDINYRNQVVFDPVANTLRMLRGQ